METGLERFLEYLDGELYHLEEAHNSDTYPNDVLYHSWEVEEMVERFIRVGENIKQGNA